MAGDAFERLRISLLKQSDRLYDFDCGDLVRNSWLKSRAKSSLGNDDSRTYVAKDGDDRVCGFYAISTASIIRGSLRGAMSRNAPDPVSGILLAQLGVTKGYQGRGLSRELVLHAMAQVVRVAEMVGCRVLMVHPATAALGGYYEKFGFVALDVTPGPVMAMSLKTVRAVVVAADG